MQDITADMVQYHPVSTLGLPAVAFSLARVRISKSPSLSLSRSSDRAVSFNPFWRIQMMISRWLPRMTVFLLISIVKKQK